MKQIIQKALEELGIDKEDYQIDINDTKEIHDTEISRVYITLIVSENFDLFDFNKKTHLDFKMKNIDKIGSHIGISLYL